MNKMTSRRWAFTLAAVLGVGQAGAVNVACPAANAIQLSETSKESTKYAATAGAYKWKGEVSRYDDDLDLPSLRFVEATIVNARHFVACDYFDKGKSNLRMTIDTSKPFAPVNQPAWTGDEQPHCANADAAACEVKES